jgi:dUTP pyrophosphatase
MIEFKCAFPGLLPTRAHPTDAGLDLRAESSVLLSPGVRQLVSTGVAARIPEGYVGLLIARSSLQKKGLALGNAVGVIDSSYRGTIFASLVNTSMEVQGIIAGERFAQLLVVPVSLLPAVEWDGIGDWDDTVRGEGGFGSTGNG